MTKKKEFIIGEIWVLAWSASVQRAKLYKKGLSSEDRKASEFKSSLISYIQKDVMSSYEDGCTEEKHLENIDAIIKRANELGEAVLGADGYKYGVAQKLLNLAVKYMWCLGHIKEPPHCPIDRIVIAKTKYKGEVNWTEMKSKAEYKNVIDEVKSLADAEKLSIAEWELHHYSRR